VQGVFLFCAAGEKKKKQTHKPGGGSFTRPVELAIAREREGRKGG